MEKKKENDKARWPTSALPDKQLLDKKAEEYLREGGNIEDLPTKEEEQEEDRIAEQVKSRRKKTS